MDKKELSIILKEGEGYKIEFKEGLVTIRREGKQPSYPDYSEQISPLVGEIFHWK